MPTASPYGFNSVVPGVSIQNSNQNSSSSSTTTQNSGSYSGPNLYLSSLFRDIYGNYLNQNNAQYNNYLSAYGNTMAGLYGTPAVAATATTPAQAATTGLLSGIGQGYLDLNQAVQNRLAGAEQSRYADINESYLRQAAQARQGLTTAGLGNTTVTNSAARGVEFDRQRASQQVANEFAQMRAGYQSQLGQGALQSQQQAANIYAQLGGQYMAGHANYGLAMPSWAPNESRSSSSSISTSNSATNSNSSSVPIIQNNVTPINPYGVPASVVPSSTTFTPFNPGSWG